MLLMATRPPATCFILPAVDSISSAFQGPTDISSIPAFCCHFSSAWEEVTPKPTEFNAPAALQKTTTHRTAPEQKLK